MNQIRSSHAGWMSLSRAVVIGLGLVLLSTCAIHDRALFNGEGVDEKSLAQFMRHSINPALTAASFSIFHDEERSTGERMERIILESGRLQEAAEKLSLFKPRLFADNTEEFQELAAVLRQYANGMSDSAHEQDLEEVTLWYNLVKNVCVSCHKVYRFGEQPPMPIREGGSPSSEVPQDRLPFPRAQK